MHPFNLKKAIAYASGREVPVAGGLGLSIDDPILIAENHHGLAVDAEQFVAREVSVFYGFWKMEIKQSKLYDHDGKKIDELTIVYENAEDEQLEAKLYFDITPGFHNMGKTVQQVKNDDELKLIQRGEYYKEHEPVDHFYGAVFWALHVGGRLAEDLETLMWIFGTESDDEAEAIKHKLEECGLLAV